MKGRERTLAEGLPGGLPLENISLPLTFLLGTALVSLVRRIESWGFHFLDCQQHTPHTEKLGAVLVPREQFLSDLSRALAEPTRRGSWTDSLDSDGPVEDREGEGSEVCA